MFTAILFRMKYNTYVYIDLIDYYLANHFLEFFGSKDTFLYH